MKVPQMTVLASVTSEGASATPASSPSHPPAETGGPRVLPDSLPSISVAGSIPQASQLAGSSQDLRGADAPGELPDDLPTNSIGGNAPQASQPSDPSHDVGGLIAYILGDVGHSEEADVPNPNRASQTSVGGGLPGNVPPSSAAGNDGLHVPGPQVSQLLESSVNIGGVVAAILNDAGIPEDTGTFQRGHAPQDTSGSDWGSPPTPASDSENSSHEAENSIPESGHSDQTPTAQPSEGQAFVTSQASANLSGKHGSGTSDDQLNEASTTTSNNESGVNEPTSTQGSNAGAAASTDSSNSIADSVSMGTILSTSGRWMKSSALMVVIMASVFVL